jgi:hypothetical protein
MKVFKKDGLFFEHKPRPKESNFIGVFYNLNKDKKRIQQVNSKGCKIDSVDGSPMWEKSIIKWNNLNK